MDIKIAMQVDANNPIVGDLYISPNGDARITNASLVEEVGQALRTSLLLWQGSWFLDPSQGVPYLQNILGQKVSLSFVSQIFRTAIMSTPGIRSLDSFNLVEVKPRGVSLTFSLTVSDGSKLDSSDFAPLVFGAPPGGGT